ncbi:MAG: cyanophycinase [Crocinitomicaceae bacterium]|nr:cyanophycinase [Crocinitomicaceae bacterium]
MTPKGKMIIIGGGVDKGSFTEKEFTDQVENNLNFFEKGILRRLLDESAQGPNSRIEIVPTASKIPKIVGDEYAKAFRFLGAENVGVLNIVNRTECENPGVLERVKKADIVFFTGGDQLRLTSIIGGTSLHEILLQKYMNEPFVYAGTSAGAACVSKQMIYQGSSSEALQKGEIKITSGLGFIDNVTIDTHFVKRGRIGRLFQAVVSNPKILGLGLGEDTGLLIKNAHTMEAIGSGLVILVDGRKITDTNITDISMGEPISINNLIVHVMSKGDVYQLNNHSFTIFKNSNLSA